MDKLRYGTALLLLFSLYANNVEAYEYKRTIINSPIKDIIYNAAINNRPDIIKKYINLGYSIDSVDGEGMSALCSAYENGNDEAFELLLKYGANQNARCMKIAETMKSNKFWAKFKKYSWGTFFVGAGITAAVGLGGGGGGSGSDSGGSGGNDSGGDNGGDIGGGNGEIDTSEDWTIKPVPSLDDTGSVVEYYSENDFINKEYTGENFGEYVNGITYNSVNYLGAINAAEAYKYVFGKDADGKFASNLQNVVVGAIDSGVWGNHDEFKTSNGSKITGYNFDYGPCRDGDTSNCWKSTGEAVCLLGFCGQEVTLLDGNGTEVSKSYVSCQGDGTSCDPYASWSSKYPENYDWDKLTYFYYPNSYNTSLDNADDLHGSNVVGIIAANRNDKGNMGVAFENTIVDAVRWDLMSSLYNPLKAMLNDNVLAVNMSVGMVASDSLNASNINENLNDETVDKGMLEAYQEIIHSYKDVKNEYTGEMNKDGMIIVKAAGNDNYSQPDLYSGIKLITSTFDNPNNSPYSSYSDLMMLTVVSVDVNLDNNGDVIGYEKSSFSNACGVTANYCIAAPGGNEVDATTMNLVYSVGQPNLYSGYVGMGGTSQAAPVVTGSIAFLKGAFPYMTSSNIIDLLMNTANKTASDYNENIYGAGLLDLGAAVTTYVPIKEGAGVTTVSGNTFNSGYVDLNTTNLTVTSTFKNAVLKALPKSITAFDKYSRPFDLPTSNYITVTHGGYKTLKNDVFNIMRKSKVTEIKDGNMTFSFMDSMNTNGLGFANAKYKVGKNTAGFYFSENTKYDANNYFKGDLKNPFMSFNSAYGIHNTIDFNNGIGIKFEAVTGENGLYDGDYSFSDTSFKKQAYALNTELQLLKNENFGFSISSGMLYEDEAVLGMNGTGAFDVSGSNTYNTGITASWFVTPKLTLSGSYYQGFTQSKSFASNLLKTSDLTSESFAFDANYKWNKDVDFGFQLSSPLRIRNGSLAVNFPSGRDNFSDTIYRDIYKASLKPEAREYKFSVYMNNDFSENLSFRSSFDVRVNPEHQKTRNDYRALFGLNWSFN